MKTNKPLFKNFSNGDLQMHISRIVNNFKENPENLNDAIPTKSSIADDGEGNKTWYLDVPNIEESYLYANKKDRDNDYKKLGTVIDLLFTTDDFELE